ncbi:MAG TPA: flippase-like domain-containing protein [archaeon]|jgi:uncharacterized protein (TIRG00374 family)|nr:flippase-like domain-containing protein [archaeon]
MERLKRLLIYSLILSISILILVSVFTVGPETVPILLSIKPGFLLLAILLHIGSFFIWGLRMKVMADALGYRIGILKATEAVVSNLFAASVTPSMAGGEPVRIHLLNQNAQMPIGDATGVVIGERVLDALFLLIATPFSLWVLRGSLLSWEMDIFIVVAEIFVLLLVIIALIGLLNPVFIDKLSSLLTRGLHKIGHFDRTEHIIEFMDLELWNFHNSLWTFLKSGKKGLFYGSFCTLVYWIMEFMILPLILLGLNQPPSIIVAFALQLFLTFLMVLPITPGASGIAELGGAALFGVIVPVSILGIVVVAWRMITYYLNLIIGGLISIRILKNSSLFNEIK